MTRFLLGLVWAAVLMLVASQNQVSALVIASIPLASNVTNHADLDKDIAAIRSLLYGNPIKATEAFDRYQFGGSSIRSDGAIRSLKSLSRELFDSIYKLGSAYHKSTTFGNVFITNAFQGQAEFEGRDITVRREAIMVFLRTMILFNYVINEAEDGWLDCKAGTPQQNIGSVFSIDEAWAFYTGSLEGAAIGGSTNGVALYRLAVEMCQQFGTCITLPNNIVVSPVNNQVGSEMALLSILTRQENDPCQDSKKSFDRMVNYMQVPIIQGFISSLLNAANTARSTTDRTLSWSAAYAYQAALAPLVSRCAPAVAEKITTKLKLNTATMPDTKTAKELIADIEAAYFCMGISCQQVGSFTNGGHVACNDKDLAGYEFRSSVMDRAFIDLDVRDISVALNQNDFVKAEQIYSQGRYSVKTDGTIRTIASLSTSFTKFSTQGTWQLFRNYYNSDTYAHRIISAALTGNAPFTTDPADFPIRREAALKGMQYMTLWYYVIHELEDAAAACDRQSTVDLSDDKDFVANVDEAWAFFTGSAHWSAGDKPPNATGYLMYNANQKRCLEFGTCTTGLNGLALANSKTLSLMTSSQAAAAVKDCKTIKANILAVTAQMTVPVIQGLLKYVFLLPGVANPKKEWGEANAFWSAVAPFVNRCDPSVATLVNNNIGLTIGAANIMKDGRDKVTKAIQSTFSCLKITCAEVGFYDASQRCVDPIPPFTLNLAGYTLLTDVTDRSRIDLDVRDINDLLGKQDWNGALQLYLLGKNSVRSSGVKRSLAKLSTDYVKFSNESTWQMYKNYYNSSTYADDLILAALNEQGLFKNQPAVVRKEVIVKGIQYLTVWNYVLHELEEATATCGVGLTGDQSSDGDDALDVDEAWAFFVGSLHIQNAANTGFLMYQANLKRCPEFKTCIGTRVDRAKANDRSMALFFSSQAAAQVKDCKTMRDNIPKIRSSMTVPLVQGLLKYVWLADKRNAASPQSELPKEWAEGFAFAQALLPMVSSCNKDTAALIKQNFDLSQTAPMQSGSAAVTAALQATYSCLGISCSEVGGFVPSQQCTDPILGSTESSALSAGAIAGIVIGCVVFYILSLVFVYYRGKKTGQEAGNQNIDVGTKQYNWQAPPAPANGNSRAATNGVYTNGNGKHDNNEQVEVV